ncbi:MAG: TrbI F-type domain-containing protein [Legionellales bacterium]|nr:TrbI F-type domain-containing protein [Legionellales bacterium]
MMRPRLVLIQWIGIILLLGWNLMNTHYALKGDLVTVDKKAVEARFVAQMSHLTLTDAELTEKTMRFGQALKGALNEYAVTNQVIILDASTVLAGRRDVTPSILSLVATNMRSLK